MLEVEDYKILEEDGHVMLVVEVNQLSHYNIPES